MRGFNRQVTFIIKSFFFTFMGAMLGPPWSLVLLGALLGIILLVARAPAVRLALLGSGLDRAERRLVLVSLPRGMAAGVLASMPAAAGVSDTANLPNVVFAGALVTILIFAVGFPMARKRAGAPDDTVTPALAETVPAVAPVLPPVPSSAAASRARSRVWEGGGVRAASGRRARPPGNGGRRSGAGRRAVRADGPGARGGCRAVGADP